MAWKPQGMNVPPDTCARRGGGTKATPRGPAGPGTSAVPPHTHTPARPGPSPGARRHGTAAQPTQSPSREAIINANKLGFGFFLLLFFALAGLRAAAASLPHEVSS